MSEYCSAELAVRGVVLVELGEAVTLAEISGAKRVRKLVSVAGWLTFLVGPEEASSFSGSPCCLHVERALQ
jgi:hypothetical protein